MDPSKNTDGDTIKKNPLHLHEESKKIFGTRTYDTPRIILCDVLM